MKRKLKLILLLLPAFFLAMCDDGPGEYGDLYVNPIIGATVEGATAQIDQDTKEINLIYGSSRDFSNISVQLTLEPGVKMVSPSTNPFTIDLSDGEYKEITVFSLNRNIKYTIKASVIIDVSEPIISFSASVGEHNAKTTIDHSLRTIDAVFEYNVDLSAVTVDYQLDSDVTVVSPTSKTWDMTEPVKLELRKDFMTADYRVTAVIGIDDSEPFTGFAAESMGTTAEVTVDHTERTLEISFDGGQIDLNAIDVEYVLDDGFEVVSPSGNVWDLSGIDNDPVYFVLTKNGLTVSYEILLDLDADFTDAVLSFEATVGGQKAMVMVNNEEKWISVAYEGAVSLSAVDVAMTLNNNITAVSPSGTTWDLSSASHENSITLILEKYGMQEEYDIYADSDLFVPSYYQGASTPEGWVRYIKGIPSTMAVYLVPEVAGEQVVAYAVVAPLANTAYSSVGDTYQNQKTLSELSVRVPNATVVINGSDAKDLLMIDGQIVENVTGNGSFSLMTDADGKGYLLSATNRLDSDGVPANSAAADTHYVNEIWWWDQKRHYPGITYTGHIGSGFLNMTAGNQGNASFPGGIMNPSTNDPRIARAAYGATQSRDAFVFFVCEGSARSAGMTRYHGLEMVRNLGAWDGGVGPTNDANIIGLVINGQSLITPTSGSEGRMSFAHVLTAK